MDTRRCAIRWWFWRLRSHLRDSLFRFWRYRIDRRDCGRDSKSVKNHSACDQTSILANYHLVGRYASSHRTVAHYPRSYIMTVIIIGFDIPYNYPGINSRSVRTSPFTLVFQMVGSKAAGSFMNSVVLTSVISAANHALFAGSRILYGLSAQHQAPKVFLRRTRHGVPWVAVLFTAAWALVFFGVSFLPGGAAEIFTWAQVGAIPSVHR